MRWALVPQQRGGGAATTDAWSAGPSTAGQRALRLAGAPSWTPVCASGQTAGAATQALRKVGPRLPENPCFACLVLFRDILCPHWTCSWRLLP